MVTSLQRFYEFFSVQYRVLTAHGSRGYVRILVMGIYQWPNEILKSMNATLPAHATLFPGNRRASGITERNGPGERPGISERVHSLTRFNSCALIATTTVLADMSTAPSSGMWPGSG